MQRDFTRDHSMNVKLLMTATSITTGAAGVALSFLPQEILASTKMPASAAGVVTLQVMGALYLGMAITDWMARDGLLGGVYGRPILLGNLAHFVAGALALLKGASAHPDAVIWFVAVPYLAFAALFSMALFSHPSRRTS
jgi:hypothetical protein